MGRDRFNWASGKWEVECIACKVLRGGLAAVAGTPVSDLKKSNLCPEHRANFESWEFAEIRETNAWPTQ